MSDVYLYVVVVGVPHKKNSLRVDSVWWSSIEAEEACDRAAVGLRDEVQSNTVGLTFKVQAKGALATLLGKVGQA